MSLQGYPRAAGDAERQHPRGMGIAPDAKVDCFVDEGELVVTAADYEHDITDVPENIRLMLSIAGVCPGRLDELLRDGAEVWHG